MKYKVFLMTGVIIGSVMHMPAIAQETSGEMPFNMQSPESHSASSSAFPTKPLNSDGDNDEPLVDDGKDGVDDTKDSVDPNKPLTLPSLTGNGVNKPLVAPTQTKAADLEDAEFNAALKAVAPLNDGMIREYRTIQKKHAESGTEYVGPQNKMISRSISLSLDAGEEPPMIHLAAGLASALTFSDRTGAQWPVLSVTTGNPDQFKVIEADEKGRGNMLVISPTTAAGTSNLVVMLVGLPVPVIFNIETSHGNIDGRLDVSIRKNGPNAHVDMAEGSSLEPTNDGDVQGFVDGLPPKGAKKLPSSDSDVEAWHYRDNMFIRTHYTLLSPAYIGKASSVSGEHVYTLSRNAPVILVEQDGRVREITFGH